MRLKKVMATLLTVVMLGGILSNPVQAASSKVMVKTEKSTEEESVRELKEELEETARQALNKGAEVVVDNNQMHVEYSGDGSEVVVEEYADAEGRTVPYYNVKTDGGNWDGTYYKRNGVIMKECFFCDGTYTYYLQNNGKAMKNKLTYHPDGKHIIYFDASGHEVFDKFQYCSDVKYTCYFDTNGYLYKDEITFDSDGNVYYLDGNGKLQQNGWFQFANGCDYGYASSDGTLNNNGFNYDPWGRVVYYHWNGMVARGLITDGNFYYDFDLSDGHYLGKFATGNPNPVYGPGVYIVGVNIPAGEIIVTGADSTGTVAAYVILYDNQDGYLIDDFGSSQIVTIKEGQILGIAAGTATTDLGSRYVNISASAYNAKIGVHLPAGVYRIKKTSGKSWGYVQVWNSRTGYDQDFVGSKEFNDSSYIDVRLSNGQILDIYNATIQYLGQ